MDMNNADRGAALMADVLEDRYGLAVDIVEPVHMGTDTINRRVLTADGLRLFVKEYRSSADLDAAQRAWVIFRQKDCEARANNYRDLNVLAGRFMLSGRILSDRGTCSLMRTKQRTEELQGMLDDLSSLDRP